MNKYIKKRLKDNLEAEYMSWAQNWIACEYQKEQGGPEAKKQVDAAQVNMQSNLARIEWFKKQIKAQE